MTTAVNTKTTVPDLAMTTIPTKVMTRVATTRAVTEMTTDATSQSERLAALKARRNAPADQRRATIGKILATGLTSTTVFGITAALGWSATSASNAKPADAASSERLVLDLSTGQLIKYVNGVPVSSQQVTSPARIASAPVTAIGQSTVAPTLPANWNPTPSGNSGSTSTSSSKTVATEPTPPTESQTQTAVVESPLQGATQVITIPVAVPQPSGDQVIDRSGGGRSGGGGGGSSGGSR